MTKRLFAVLGTITTASILAVGGWLLFQTEPAAAANPPQWLTDMQKAQDIATKENKDLLINFTGSDWCGWCIRLRDEVFTKPGFEKAGDKFVLVEMDFPQDESIIPPKTREQNELWSTRFGVEGFPTIVLTDAQGRPYGALGYVEGGPKVFMEQVTEISKVKQVRDEHFAQANKAKGVEKAKLLATAIDKIPAEYQLPMYREEVKTIVSLDENDEAGLKTRFTKVLQESEAKERIQSLQNEVRLAYSKDGAEAALKLVQEAIKEKETQANPILKGNLAQAEVQLLITFEKTKEAMTRLAALTNDESFTKEARRGFREKQAELLQEAGKMAEAIEALDALIAEVGEDAQAALPYLNQKADALEDAERSKEALEVYGTLVKRMEKGTNEWMTVQFKRGELLRKSKQPKEAAAIFEEMLTSESLNEMGKAMILVSAAEAYQESNQETQKEKTVKKADQLVKTLIDSEEYPPQYLEPLSERLETLRKGKQEPEKSKEE